MNTIRKRAARLHAEHAPKIDAVIGIKQFLLIVGDVTPYKRYFFIQTMPYWLCLALWLACWLTACRCLGKKRPPRVKYRLAGASSLNTAATVSSGK